MTDDRSTTDTAAPAVDRRSAQRERTNAEIVEAAWQLVRRAGLGGLSLRQLGELVGMRAPSLYSYFDSKSEIYDAMFHEGYVAFEAWMTAAFDEPIDDPRARLRLWAHRFMEFATSDPVRYQLLFQRTIPDFEPSEQSYALAVQVLENTGARLATVGLTSPEAVDVVTAVFTGFAGQQIANDPKGERWERLLDRTADMLFDEFAEPAPAETRPDD